VVFKIRENEELSAGATPTSGSETLLEVPPDKPTAGSEPESPDERLPGMTLGLIVSLLFLIFRNLNI
jgi:hypothetical protein